MTRVSLFPKLEGVGQRKGHKGGGGSHKQQEPGAPYPFPHGGHAGVKDAVEDLLQVRRHDHQPLDAFLQLHQR